MFKTTLVAVAGAAVLVAPLTAGASPAVVHVPNKHCTTEKGYHKVKKHQTIKKADRELGSKGTYESGAHSGGYADQIRSYHTCDQYGSVAVGFEKTGSGPWNVTSKSGVFSGK